MVQSHAGKRTDNRGHQKYFLILLMPRQAKVPIKVVTEGIKTIMQPEITPLKLSGKIYLALCYIFLYMPIIFMMVFSFNESRYIFPVYFFTIF